MKEIVKILILVVKRKSLSVGIALLRASRLSTCLGTTQKLSFVTLIYIVSSEDTHNLLEPVYPRGAKICCHESDAGNFTHNQPPQDGDEDYTAIIEVIDT